MLKQRLAKHAICCANLKLDGARGQQVIIGVSLIRRTPGTRMCLIGKPSHTANTPKPVREPNLVLIDDCSESRGLRQEQKRGFARRIEAV